MPEEDEIPLAAALEARRAHGLSLVVPMFNEQENVRPLLGAALRALPPLVTALEIVLVDDGSRDDTRRLVREAARHERRIRLVSHERNRGLGAALRTGFASATQDLILYTDADLPFDLSEVARALPLLDEAELVAGHRLNPAADGPRRALYRAVYRGLTRGLFGLQVRDVNFALKLFRRRLLERFSLESEGSFVDAELLIRARSAGARLAELGVAYQPRTRGDSTLASPRVILGILREMARLGPALRRAQRGALLDREKQGG